MGKRDPVWVLEKKIVPRYTEPNDDEPSDEQLAELREWANFLRWRANADLRYRSRSEAMERFQDLRKILLQMKPNRLRAAYWEAICKIRGEAEDLWKEQLRWEQRRQWVNRRW